MKRFFPALIAIVLVLTCVMPSTALATETPTDIPVTKHEYVLPIGDLDGSGEITSTDALSALQASVQKLDLDEYQEVAADVDESEIVTSADALIILQYAVQKVSSFPKEQTKAATMEYSLYETKLSRRISSAKKMTGPITAQQSDASYNSNHNFKIDMNMTHTYTGELSKMKKWAENHGGVVSVFTPINRGSNTDYYKNYPEREGKDEQRGSDGNYRSHPSSGAYMVPTEYYVEYKKKILAYCLSPEEYFVNAVVVEEPEMYLSGVYGEGFKEEWVKYYGTEWEDPILSIESEYRTAKLIIHLFTKAITELSQYVKSISPNTKFIVAAHSAVGYSHHKIISGIHHYSEIPSVDGIIGQTWSDTCANSMPYNGGTKVDIFIEGLGEYGSYAQGFRDDQWVFALADPKSDNVNVTWEECKERYLDTVAAQLMFGNIRRYELMPWPHRCFVNGPADYQTMQLNTFKAIKEGADKQVELYGGTQGVYVANSDTMTWQKGSYAEKSRNAHYAIVSPLAEKGITPNILNLDTLKSTKDLDNVELLVLSYEYQKPVSEKVNKILSDWVKEGGTLLYIGGTNNYDALEQSWWKQKGQTPLENLLSNLGLKSITLGSLTKYEGNYEWKGDSRYCSRFESASPWEYGGKAITFNGSGFTEIIGFNGSALGIEAKAGKGNVVCFGVSPEWFAGFRNASIFLRQLVEYALSKTDCEYIESDLMLVKRGNVVAAHAFSAETICGNFVDLYDPDLPFIIEKEIEKNTSTLLYDVTEYMEQDTPLICAFGGNLSVVEQSEQKTEFNIDGPSEATAAIRIMCNGYTMSDISVVRDGGGSITSSTEYDEDSDSLLVKVTFKGANNINVVINWE